MPLSLESIIVGPPGTEISFLESGQGTAFVLLHGIGSAARSWANQLAGLGGQFRVVAWNAPGYGQSAPLKNAAPDASDYADALGRLLDALGIDACHLVGQSLGTLMAARFAAEHPDRILSLSMISSSSGHARLTAEERARLLQGRIDDVDQLGIAGMAAKRGPNLPGPQATTAMRQAVIDTMASLHPGGYFQAARMLSGADTRADIARLRPDIRVQFIFGDQDRITPPEANRQLASARPGAPIHVVSGAGHAIYLEQPALLNELLARFAEAAPVP